MRIVLDTNILIRGHHRIPSLPRRLLNSLLDSDHRLIISNDLLAEVTRELRYPRFQKLYGLTDAELIQYVQFLQSVSTLVALDPGYLAPIRDPYDLIVLQTAEKGGADLLCTSDRDFYDPIVLAYCAARGIEVCREEDLWARLRA